MLSALLTCPVSGAASANMPVTRPDYRVYSPRNSQSSKALENLRMRGDTYNDHFQVIFDETRKVLYAFWTQATSEGNADHHIAFSKSSDKGKSWSEPVVLAGSECRAYPKLAASWQQPMLTKSGRLYCLWNQQTASRQKSTTMLYGQMFGVYSDDAGETWTGLQKVPMERMDKDSAELGVDPCWCNWQRPLRLGKDGRFFVGCTRFGKAPYDKCSGSGVEFWQFENIDDDPEVGDIRISVSAKNRETLPGVEEASVVKLPDGRLFAEMRSGMGCPMWSQSRDGGRTWSALKPLVDAEGNRIPHPMSPCPLYDWKGPEAGSGTYFTFAHMAYDNTKGPYQTRGPLYLLAGRFDPNGEQPIRFSAPKLFWSCKAGNSFYTSYTIVDGDGILWFPDRKYHLYGHRIGPEWFEQSDILNINQKEIKK